MTEDVTHDTRSRLHAVALELFATQGFQRTSLQRIADRLGITKPALYYHFPSKAALIRSLIEPLVSDVDALLNELEAEKGRVDARRTFESFFDILHKHRPVFAGLVRDPSAFAYADLESWAVSYNRRFQDLLAGPDAPVERRVRAVAAIGGIIRCVVFLDLPPGQLRPATVGAACDALGVGNMEEP